MYRYVSVANTKMVHAALWATKVIMCTFCQMWSFHGSLNSSELRAWDRQMDRLVGKVDLAPRKSNINLFSGAESWVDLRLDFKRRVSKRIWSSGDGTELTFHSTQLRSFQRWCFYNQQSQSTERGWLVIQPDSFQSHQAHLTVLQ